MPRSGNFNVILHKSMAIWTRIWGVATITDAQRRRYADFVVDLVLNGLVRRD